MMKTGMRGIGQAGLGALGIVLCSACTVSNGELRAMNGPRPSERERAALVAKAQQALQDKFKAEEGQVDQAASDYAKAKLEKALEESDKLLAQRRAQEATIENGGKEVKPDPNPPPGGKIVEVKCFATMCKGQSTHVSEEAYEAFTHAAFVSGENRYHGWSVVAQLQTLGNNGRSTTFYVGKAKAPDAKAPDAQPLRPQRSPK